LKRLPDAEFEVMKVIWRNTPPLTTNRIIEHLNPDLKWKPQTVLTMLIRLIEKGFLSSEKVGKERQYAPIISEKDYLSVETGNFMKRYYGNSLGSLVKTFYDGKALSKEDLAELKAWLDERM
jgi:predicted transcriptional regulator